MGRDDLPEIKNGSIYYFKTVEFIDNVRRYIPIELELSIALLNKMNRDIKPLEEFENLDSREELDNLLKNYFPMIRISLFRNVKTFRYFDAHFKGDLNPIINNVIKPFSIKIINIIKLEFDADRALCCLCYDGINDLCDIPPFIDKCNELIDNIFRVLNNNKNKVIKLLTNTYGDLGLLINKAYVSNYIKYPDKFLDYEDGSMVGVFKSDFATTYLYPNGFKKYI